MAIKAYVPAIIITMLLLFTSITAVIAENCQALGKKKCARGSTIALTVVMALTIAATSPFWLRPVFLPETAKAGANLIPTQPSSLSRFPSVIKS